MEVEKIKSNSTRVFTVQPNASSGILSVIDHFDIVSSPTLEGFGYNGTGTNGYSNKVYFTEEHNLLASNVDDSEFGEESVRFILKNFSKFPISVLSSIPCNNQYQLTQHDTDEIERILKNGITSSLVSNENSNIARVVTSRLVQQGRGKIICPDYNTMLLYQAVAFVGGYGTSRIPDTMNFMVNNTNSIPLTTVKESSEKNLMSFIPRDKTGRQLHCIYNYNGNIWIL